MEHKRLLITCFEPFGGRTENASRLAVQALPRTIGPFEVHRLCLPVEFGRAAEITLAAFERLRPHALICVGEAARRTHITPEMVAINLRHASIPDNANIAPHDEPVVPGGENALFSTLPVRAMAQAICDAGLPGEVSYSAGTYVCNDLMYLTLRALASSGIPCGFVHVPTVGLSIEQLTIGLSAAIETLG